MAKMRKNQEKRRKQIRDVRLRKLQKELKQMKKNEINKEKKEFFFIILKLFLSSGYFFVKSIVPMEITFLTVLILISFTILILMYNIVSVNIQHKVVQISSYMGDAGILFTLFFIMSENLNLDFTCLIQYEKYITISIITFVFIFKYFFSKKES